MRHRARPKLLGLVRLPDRSRPRGPRDRSRFSPRGRPTRVAAAVAGGLVLAGGGAYAVTGLIDEPEAPYAGGGATPDRTDSNPVSRGSKRPALSKLSSPSASTAGPSPTPDRGKDTPTASKDSGSSAPKPDLPSPTTVVEKAQKTAGKTIDQVTPSKSGERDGSSRQRDGGEKSGSSHTERSGSTSSPSSSSSPRQSRTSSIDRDAPQTTIDGTLGSAYPSFDFGSDEAGSTFTCSVDGGPYNPCSSGIDLADLGPGKHTLKVIATDRHGNSDPTPAVTTWVVRGASLGD